MSAPSAGTWGKDKRNMQGAARQPLLLIPLSSELELSRKGRLLKRNKAAFKPTAIRGLKLIMQDRSILQYDT